MSITTSAPTATDIVDGVHQLEDHAVKAIAKVQTERDEEVRGLKAAIANLVGELHAERKRATTAEAAGVEIGNALAATLRRELQLSTRLRLAYQDIRGLKQDAAQQSADHRHLSEQLADLEADNRGLRAELADRPTRRLRRRHG